jgi:hypothetical protein
MDAFFAVEEEIGPFTLRPWTVFTQLAISELNKYDLSELEQMLAFVWIQSKSPKDIRVFLSQGTALEEIKDFCDNFPLALIAPVSEWVKFQNKLIADNQVEVIPRPDSEDKNAPKN